MGDGAGGLIGRHANSRVQATHASAANVPVTPQYQGVEAMTARGHISRSRIVLYMVVGLHGLHGHSARLTVASLLRLADALVPIQHPSMEAECAWDRNAPRSTATPCHAAPHTPPYQSMARGVNGGHGVPAQQPVGERACDSEDERAHSHPHEMAGQTAQAVARRQKPAGSGLVPRPANSQPGLLGWGSMLQGIT